MDQELISIREASRRLKVSDTTLHKAIKSGRIRVANLGESRPKLRWPEVQTQFVATADPVKLAATQAARTPATSRANLAPVDPLAELDGDEEEGEQPDTDESPDYYKARARRTHYLAKTARLEYEQKQGRLIDSEEVALQWTKLITAAKTRILGIPAACKSRVADLPMPVLATIERVCREALESLANDRD